jgi:hypothetical protein
VSQGFLASLGMTYREISMHTGKSKIEAAFSPQGTDAIAAVICYEGIYTRDHWEALFDLPWWYSLSPNLEQQLAWRGQLIEKTGQDWFDLPACAPEEEREDLFIEEQAGGVSLVDRQSGERSQLIQPVVGGWREAESLNPVHPQNLPLTFAEVEGCIPLPEPFDPVSFKQAGQDRLAKQLLERYGKDYYPIGYASGPQWGCYYLWGFEDWMMLTATDPELVRFASQRQLAWSLNEVREAAALGAGGIWIEDCMVDMISRKAFESINLPLIQALVGEIRRLGMQSIYYYCGDPKGKLDLLIETGADALSLEESKKGFTIDIAEVAQFVDGRCALLGNLDAIHLLPEASDEALRGEILRQVEAGWRNGGRFVMSIGSPVTPGTPPERVRRYTDLVHEIRARGKI